MDKNKLVKLLLKYRKAYYEGNPLISDEEFDELEDQLREIDPENNYFSLVGSKETSSGDDIVFHKYPMLSMRKAKSIDDLYKWLKGINCESDDMVVEPKIDGISATCKYNNKGILEYVATRGDGKEGRKIMYGEYIKDIPSKISITGEEIEIRGELYIPKNSKLLKIDEYANSPLRNLCSGIIKRKDLSKEIEYVRFVAYDIIFYNKQIIYEEKTVSKKLEFLKTIVKNTVPHFITTFKLNMKSSPDFIFKKYLDEYRKEWEYETDGLIFVINNTLKHQKIDMMRTVDHHHHYCIALKPPSESKLTEVVDIEWEVSKNGYLIPTAILKKVEIGGVDIERVTLSNFSKFLEYKLGKNTVVEVERANDVIPHLVRVVERKNHLFEIPNVCPSCGSTLYKDGVNLVCKNRDCKDKIINKVYSWFSNLNAKNIGIKVIEDLYDAGAIKGISDMYKSNISEILSLLPGYSKNGTKISKIVESINNTKNITELDLISNIGIPGVGRKMLEKAGIVSINDIIKIRKDNYADKNSSLYRNIKEWVNDDGNYNELLELKNIISSK